MNLSIIIPMLNEEECVRPLYNSILEAVEPLGLSFEIICVDDGSTDTTFERMAALAKADRRVRAIKLRRNYGQTAATAAGIDHAAGEVLVTMDGDLQNDPADIPHLIAKIDEGYDLVAGWRRNRQDLFLSRRLPSIVANRLISMVAGREIKDSGCSLRAYRAGLARRLRLYGEMHRFIPVIASLADARTCEIEVGHHPRRHGTSKYGLSRIYKVFLDLVTIRVLLAFARHPFRWALRPGGAAAGFSLIFFGLWAVQESHRTSIVLMGLSMILGALAISLFFIGGLAHVVHRAGRAQADR